MAKTLDSIAKSNRTQSVQTGLSTSGASTSPVQTQQSKQLSQDIESLKNLVGGAEKGTKAVFEASVWADGKRADDANLQHTKGQQAIDDYYKDVRDNNGSPRELTVSEIAEKRKWQKDFYRDTVAGSINPNDKENDIYKDRFLLPSADLLKKIDDSDSKDMLSAYKVQWTQGFKAEADALKQNFQVVAIKDRVSEAKTLGDPSANKTVWYEVGVSTIGNFESIDSANIDVNNKSLMLDTYFGNYLKYNKDGSIAKVDKTMDDDAYRAMMASFNGKINSIETANKAKVKKVTPTIVKSMSSLDAKTQSSSSMQTSVDRSLLQLKELLDTGELSQAKYDSSVDAIYEGRNKVALGKAYENMYKATISEGGSFSLTSAIDWTYQVEMRSVGKGITKTLDTFVLTPEQIQGYFASNLAQDIEKARVNPKTTLGQANNLAKVAAELKNSTNISSSAYKPLENISRDLSTTGGSSFNTLEERNKAWSMAITYNNGINENKVGGVNDKVYELQATEIVRLKEIQASQGDKPTLTNTKINLLVAQYTDSMMNVYSSPKTSELANSLMEEFSSDLNNLYDEFSPNRVPIVGSSTFIVGSTTEATINYLGIIDKLAIAHNSKAGVVPITTTEQYKEFGRSATVVLNKSAQAGYNLIAPSPYSGATGKSIMNSIKKIAMKETKGETGVETVIGNINFSDIARDDKVQISNYVSDSGTVIYHLQVYGSNGLIYSRPFSPDELEKGIAYIKGIE